MARILRILVALLLVAAGCSDKSDSADESSPETTELESTAVPTSTPLTTTTSSSSSTTVLDGSTDAGVWSVVQVDAEVPNGTFGPDGLRAVMMPDGRPRVIYGVGTLLRMATCVDVACSSVDVAEIVDTAPFGAGNIQMSAALRGDGSPVVMLYGTDPARPASLEGEQEQLVWCVDPACESVVSRVLPQRRYLAPQLVTAPDGRVAVFDLVTTTAILPPPTRCRLGTSWGSPTASFQSVWTDRTS